MSTFIANNESSDFRKCSLQIVFFCVVCLCFSGCKEEVTQCQLVPFADAGENIIVDAGSLVELQCNAVEDTENNQDMYCDSAFEWEALGSDTVTPQEIDLAGANTQNASTRLMTTGEYEFRCRVYCPEDTSPQC